MFRAFSIAVFGAIVHLAAAEEGNATAWLESNALPANAASSNAKSKHKYFNAAELAMEGHPFEDTLTSFSRIPVRYKETVTKGVWNTGTNSAGVAVRFVTDSPEISAIWNNAEPMNHMAWTGSGGLDLYKRIDGKWVFRSAGRPTTTTDTMAEFRGIDNSNGKPAEYLVFLPLYSKVDKVQIGVADGASLAPAPPRHQEQLPIVFYGTSITQGGCASRAGMAHPALLRRWLDYPVINFGFSGSGKCEPVMSDLLAEIPASLYVVETVSNMTTGMITERVVPFMKNLREKRPDTPILMVESPNGSRETAENAVFRDVFEELKSGGMKNLHYLPTEEIYSGREDPTVDGSHPTDLGFYEMALSYEKKLKEFMTFDAGKPARLK